MAPPGSIVIGFPESNHSHCFVQLDVQLDALKETSLMDLSLGSGPWLYPLPSAG